MTNKFKVLQDCYYGEPGDRHRFIKQGDVYESSTLTEEKAPKYFKLITEKKVDAPQAPSFPKPDLPINNQGDNMTYAEMKKFVTDNDIDTPDLKTATLSQAIIEFVETKAQLAKDEANVELEGQQIASELRNTPAAAFTDENGPDKPIVNAE